MRMWNPAFSVPLYLPSRSTTQACCCGTTRAIREMTNIAKKARTTTTTTLDMIRSPIGLLLVCADMNGETVNVLDTRALSGSEVADADVAGGPGRAAHLRFADRRDGD